jgi:hypothetical protein
MGAAVRWRRRSSDDGSSSSRQTSGCFFALAPHAQASAGPVGKGSGDKA